ncbi:hypothetical protein DINM_001668 [Dirofilaria immitis]|nr:hypothetical protein [Dirofilaria immitis]
MEKPNILLASNKHGSTTSFILRIYDFQQRQDDERSMKVYLQKVAILRTLSYHLISTDLLRILDTHATFEEALKTHSKSASIHPQQTQCFSLSPLLLLALIFCLDTIDSEIFDSNLCYEILFEDPTEKLKSNDELTKTNDELIPTKQQVVESQLFQTLRCENQKLGTMHYYYPSAINRSEEVLLFESNIAQVPKTSSLVRLEKWKRDIAQYWR